jgi:serine/threonine-protein kinase CTR1
MFEEIGHGTFGSVHRAIWRGDTVAAKKLKCKLEDTELIQSFQRETLLLRLDLPDYIILILFSKMRHPNIVMIMAASCRAPELIIVTEHLKSDLSVLLYSKEKIEWKERLQMALDVARGMNYLHNMDPPMIHRDLKSNNCLIDDHRRVKVSDFGTAVTREKMGTELVGTAAYMSPERLREEQSDEKTDVFAFGVMLWELLQRKIPWEGLTNIQVFR